jgi:hypothetical protein
VSTSIAQQPDELSANAKALAKRLGSRKAQERQKAEQQVREMDAAGRDLLIAILRHEEHRRKSRRGELYLTLAVLPFWFGIPALLLYVRYGTWRGAAMMLSNLIVAWMVVAFVASIVTRAHTNAAYLLAKYFDDVSIIGPLAEALEYRSRPVREAATSALVRLLPRLQESDSDLLTSEQRTNLHRALMGKNPELVVAVLNALEVTGDGTAIPNVQKLASGLGVAGADKQIQARAQHILLVLRQRAEAQCAPQMLLRAASAGEVGTEVLLRPAAGAGDSQEQVLLRPVNNGTEERG